MKWRKVGKIEPMNKVDRTVDPIEANHVEGKMIVLLVHFPLAMRAVPKCLPFVARWRFYELNKKGEANLAMHGYWECVYGSSSYGYHSVNHIILGWMPLEEFKESYKDLV